ncbi:MAG: glycosyltransferase [Actinomycetota bacterium]|nr:glycosyltransferase [Actinomycetota bacterium]
MRILVVSAHYPPDFVSGGTLTPQRLARGLRARGHHVSVYAGSLNSERLPLSSWSEVDETGLPVRWVASWPWIGWDDPNCYDNERVTADFAEHVARTNPDVVHFHALQSLGAGLLAAARAAGARVVVTMHDFWWICARQFLVDRDYRPCCVVVDAGACVCEVDRSWLAARTARLAELLSHADVVLAPSASAVRILAANGVDPAKLQVDENGMADESGTVERGKRPGRGPADGVCFLYAGGSNRMKGVHVVLEAARRLRDRPGWRLSLYDVDEYLRRSGASVDGLPVDLYPPFAPEEADAVFASYDVLVVPSVMRESYSIVTREALLHGLPVVCTDSVGPEEVVEHGRNGLVVPTADPNALAEAMGRLVDDRELLSALQAGCTGLRVRSLREQLDGLERTFTAPLVPTAPTPASGGIARVLFICGIEGAPLRYRARLPAEALALRGVRSDVLHYRDPRVDAAAQKADAVIVYRVPATTQVLALLERVRDRGGAPLLFDVDDLIFDPVLAPEIPALRILPEPEAELWLEGVRRYRTTMEACDVYVGSTAALCRHAADVTGLPTEGFDNGVGIVVSRLSDLELARPRVEGSLRLGYFSGTDTHDEDWAYLEPAIANVLGRHQDVELWLVGLVTPSPALDTFADRVRRLPLLEWTQLPAALRDIDVNLAPLDPGGRFNEAKSAIKWLEAALTATPTVASSTEPFRDAIVHGDNGLLAADLDDWVACLDHLVEDEQERKRLSHRARRDALLRWSPHLQGHRYLDLLERARAHVAGGRPLRASAWEPLVLDEPVEPAPCPLEPYGTEPAGRHEPGRAAPIAARAWRTFRDEGPGVAARRTAALVRRALRHSR